MRENGVGKGREQLLHALYEAAELEHNLMCTYLYAAFSLRSGTDEGLSAEEAEAVARWRAAIIRIAVDEMSHLTAVWNITSALGGTPRFGRGNFPLDPGALPAGVVVRLAPFGDEVLQHFIHLERPEGADEPDGAGFAPEFAYTRGVDAPRLTPMAVDYDTVGTFYATLSEDLRAFVERVGEPEAFCGDRALQLTQAEVALAGAKPVICAKTALAAFTAIVEEGEGARVDADSSHYQRFLAIRTELAALRAKNPHFSPAHPAATNPVLRRPLRSEGRVWIENEASARVVDLANTAYGLMLRLMAYSYAVPSPLPEKALAISLSLGLMRAMTHLGERAARMPAGDAHPGCNAGVSFAALRDAAPFPHGESARRFFVERLDEMSLAGAAIAASGDARAEAASRQLADLAKRAARGFAEAERTSAPKSLPVVAAQTAPSGTPPVPTRIDDVDFHRG
jgi:hypothetical protein